MCARNIFRIPSSFLCTYLIVYGFCSIPGPLLAFAASFYIFKMWKNVLSFDISYQNSSLVLRFWNWVNFSLKCSEICWSCIATSNFEDFNLVKYKRDVAFYVLESGNWRPYCICTFLSLYVLTYKRYLCCFPLKRFIDSYKWNWIMNIIVWLFFTTTWTNWATVHGWINYLFGKYKGCYLYLWTKNERTSI